MTIANKLFRSTAAALTSVLWIAPSHAHHSAAAFYQMDKQVTVDGVVKSFSLGNPHARIYMTVKGPDGKDQDWMAEGGSRTVLLRQGWTENEVQPGDRVKIVGNPSRDGSNVVHWEKLIRPDGKELWGEDLNPSKLEELRKRRTTGARE
jgi:phenylpropionate dioxygenase-like ring-hydroxylating dioxygenase large terminal subunit